MPLDGAELLGVAHDFSKVDVEHVPAVFQHDVVVVPVTDAQDEGGHTPARTGMQEVHHSLEEQCEGEASPQSAPPFHPKESPALF